MLKGTRPQAENYWRDRFALSATLYILSNIARIFDGKSDSTRPQLFYMDLIAEKGLNGGALSVDLTRAFTKWISLQEEHPNRPDIAQPMRRAYEYLTGIDTERLYRVEAMFRKPYWINLSVPGNACGLYPQSHYFETDADGNPAIKGYPLLSHNADSPVQQLALIMGIAAMHDEARLVIF